MAITPLLSTLDSVQGATRIREDDSRKRTQAEIAADVTPVNYAYAPYSANRYGFEPSATATSNVITLQAAVDAAYAGITFRTYSGDLFGANTYSGPYLVIPDGEYSIDGPIALHPYTVIRANKVILRQTDATKDHFTCSDPYRIDIEGITFKGGKRALYASGVNTNTSRVRIARCEFHTANTTNYAVVVDTQTCNTIIEDCLVLDSPLFLDVVGDYAEIRNCWVHGYLASTGNKPDSTASVNNRCRYMRVCGGSWVPEEDGGDVSTATRWFDNRGGMLSLDDVQFGAENGGLPIVYEFGSAIAASSPFVAINGVWIRNCQLSQGRDSRTDKGVVVLQGVVPSTIDIRGGRYVVFGKVISDNGFTSPTLAAWLTSNLPATGNKISITIENIEFEPSSDVLAEIMPSALLQFARVAYGARGSNPGVTLLGPINSPIREYEPNFTATEARALGGVSGQKRNPVSATYFDALTISKPANDATGSAAAVIILDVVASGEVSGPTAFVLQAQFRITLIGGRSSNIGATVETVTENNRDNAGGTSVGNVLTCQVTGTSTTLVTVQLRINTTIAAGAVAWSARMLSVASEVGADKGRVFSMVSA